MMHRLHFLSLQYFDAVNNNGTLLGFKGETLSNGDLRQAMRLPPLLQDPRAALPPTGLKRKYSEELWHESSDASDEEQAPRSSKVPALQPRPGSNGEYGRSYPLSGSPGEPRRAPSPAPFGCLPHDLSVQPMSVEMSRPSMGSPGSSPGGGPIPLHSTMLQQQMRPSVITCAPPSRNAVRSQPKSSPPLKLTGDFGKEAGSSAPYDPVVEEHFRRSLGRHGGPGPAAREAEPAAVSPSSCVSVTGSVDEHFAKALGDTWLRIKAAEGDAAPHPAAQSSSSSSSLSSSSSSASSPSSSASMGGGRGGSPGSRNRSPSVIS
ncbi:transcription cofactor vestigial-like protein 4 [Lampetra planeri]